jgi:hypothetical protein
MCFGGDLGLLFQNPGTRVNNSCQDFVLLQHINHLSQYNTFLDSLSDVSSCRDMLTLILNIGFVYKCVFGSCLYI